jgi:hypothetical protein
MRLWLCEASGGQEAIVGLDQRDLGDHALIISLACGRW